MGKWDLEVTDTFGGQANYCWVDRCTIHAKSDRTVIRELKRMMGITGEHADVSDFGETYEVRPTGRNAPCIVGFATWRE